MDKALAVLVPAFIRLSIFMLFVVIAQLFALPLDIHQPAAAFVSASLAGYVLGRLGRK